LVIYGENFLVASGIERLFCNVVTPMGDNDDEEDMSSEWLLRPEDNGQVQDLGTAARKGKVTQGEKGKETRQNNLGYIHGLWPVLNMH
jgi:hypothetical protein